MTLYSSDRLLTGFEPASPSLHVECAYHYTTECQHCELDVGVDTISGVRHMLYFKTGA